MHAYLSQLLSSGIFSTEIQRWKLSHLEPCLKADSAEIYQIVTSECQTIDHAVIESPQVKLNLSKSKNIT